MRSQCHADGSAGRTLSALRVVGISQMITGELPFRGGYDHATGFAIVNSPPRPMTELRADIPAVLDQIVMRCLEKLPAQRYATAAAVRDELRTTQDTGARAPVYRTGSRRRQWWVVAGAVVVLAAGIAGYARFGRHAGSTQSRSIAVLPFVNMSSEGNQEYFSDGLTEQLIDALVKIPDLKVAGRTSSFSFKENSDDLRSIGEKLKVANILEGSVRKSGDRIRITVQLVKAADGFHLWSQTYDRTLDDIFAVQDDIAQRVAEELQVTLLGRSAPAAQNAQAYDLVLRARYTLQVINEETIQNGAQPILMYQKGAAVAAGERS